MTFKGHYAAERSKQIWIRPKVCNVVWCAFLIAATALFALGRISIIASRIALNPDEAQLLADARRASISFVPYDTFTTPTYGPIWPMLLAVYEPLF